AVEGAWRIAGRVRRDRGAKPTVEYDRNPMSPCRLARGDANSMRLAPSWRTSTQSIEQNQRVAPDARREPPGWVMRSRSRGVSANLTCLLFLDVPEPCRAKRARRAGVAEARAADAASPLAAIEAPCRPRQEWPCPRSSDDAQRKPGVSCTHRGEAAGV